MPWQTTNVEGIAPCLEPSDHHIVRAAELFAGWNALVPMDTRKARTWDFRSLGAFGWGDQHVPLTIARLLQHDETDIVTIAQAWDVASARSVSRKLRRRRIGTLRGFLKYAHDKDGHPLPYIRTAVDPRKDAA